MSINEPQKHHSLSRVSSTSVAQSRQKFVEILAGTANGSHSELGYFPDMPQRFKELEDQNAQWRLENTKLYQDNASLLGLIRQQNEHIKEICAPDSEKNIRIMELNSELQKTRIQRDELARAQTANNRTPSQLQQDFTNLQGDYMRILTGYRSKCAEVERLQHQIRTLTAQFSSRPQSLPQVQTQHIPQHQPQQQAQQQSRPQVQQHPQHQLQQQFQPQSLPQIQHQYQPVHQLVYVQRPQANHPAQWESGPSLLHTHVQQQHPRSVPGPQQQSPPVFGQVQKQKNPLSQTQQAIFDQRNQAIPTSQHPRSRQSSGNVPGQELLNMANSQRHPPLLHGERPSSSRPNSEPPHSTSQIVPTMPEPLTNRPRTSLSNSSGHPTQVVSPHSLNQLFFSPPSSDFNLDLPQTVFPPSNMVSTPIESNTSTYVPLTVSPQDTYLISGNQVPSPQVNDVQGFEASTSSFGTSISPVASQPVNVALGLSASIPPHQVNSLKRESPTEYVGQHDVREQLQKRARLESSQLELKTNNSTEPIADGTEDTVQMDIDKDEVVEVGPDGLRLVNDCISDLFGDEGEGEEGKGRYCKLCIVRRNMGYVTDSPKPFVNATNDELQEHCMTEHAEAWDTLRQTV